MKFNLNPDIDFAKRSSLLSLLKPEGLAAIFTVKLKIVELVPNEVKNLAPSLLRLSLATSLAMAISTSGFGFKKSF